MASRKNLTASNIRYLLTMKELDNEGNGVRCVDIASTLKLSKPSVHNMLDTFVEMGFIRKAAYGIAIFTELGNETALRYDRYYRYVSGVLSRSFPELAGDVQTATCSLISVLPQQSLERICGERVVTAEGADV